MSYPIIKHIKDVLPYIKGEDDFKHSVKGFYQNIVYRSLNPHETFPENNYYKTHVLRECRGIAFDLDGNIISRPFHKFFNYGERESTNYLNFEYPHTILEKLDGSMIHPIKRVFPVVDENDNVIEEIISFSLATKAGVGTDTAMRAEMWLNDEVSNKRHRAYCSFIENCIKNNQTPIFEWCSNKDRIVVNHEEEDLVLLAIRDNVTGEYLSYNKLQYARPPEVSIVKERALTKKEILNFQKENETEEGFVIYYKDKMIKIKTDWYCLIHKTKDEIRFEKNMLRIILEDNLDDILPMITDKDREVVLNYASDIKKIIKRKSAEIILSSTLIRSVAKDRKEAAQLLQSSKLSKTEYPIFWKVYDGNDAEEFIINFILKNCSSSGKLDNIRKDILGDIVYEFC